VLPHALAYNAAAAPGPLRRIAQALGKDHAPQAVFDLARGNGAPVALKEIGMKEEDLERACDLAMENRYPNPRPLERAPLLQLLRDAFEGARPA
jgi:alcohol dehydrogenase class IV